MAEFLMKPKIDFAFKEIMMDEKARIGFLAAVLKIPPKEIKETWILNTALRKEHEDDKQGILDVRLLLNSDQEVDIEIQLSELRVWADRSLFYLSKMFTEQIRPGESYRVLKKCVGISILDFVLFKDVAQKGGEPQGDAGFYSCFHIREDSRHFIYTDKMEFHVIELPKLPQEVREGCSDIELWARFINAEKKEVFDMLAKNDPYIGSAYQRLQLISQDRQMRMEYETREKAIRDYNEGMLEAEERGEERGRKEGISIGEERGRKAEALSIARKLVGMGFPTEEIVKITLLSEKEIEGLH
ncbi:MAG: Rpn family recombination-promoting nuclease/putative transposase [Lachnospiraceae bacterium]|nr:Rpn family recombination-promoting nuclease/putative transposase [Lachnospiraceae bacterium]